MAQLEPIARTVGTKVPFDEDRQRLLAYDPRRDEFVESRRWAPFKRLQLWLVSHHGDPGARLEGEVDWHLPGLDGGDGVDVRTRYVLACAAGHEERFVRAWALDTEIPAEDRVLDLLAAAASGMEPDEAQTGEAWLAGFAKAATVRAMEDGALLSTTSALLVEDAASLWDVVRFTPPGGTEREAEVEVVVKADVAATPVRGSRRHSERALRQRLREGLQAGLVEHIGPGDPLSRLSASGRRVQAAVDEAARSLGRTVSQFRLAPFALSSEAAGEGAAHEAASGRVEAPREPESEHPPSRLAALSQRLEATLDEVARVDGASSEAVTFHAFHPRRARAGRADTFLVFADPSAAGIREGTPVTVVLEPDGDDVVIEPRAITTPWTGRRVRYAFDVWPGAARRLIRVSVQVAGIEIGRIARCEVEPVDQGDGERATASGALYQRIFVSSAPGEAGVVERLRAVREAVGPDALVDTAALRTAPDWRSAVRTAIDEVDVFQLLWSEAAARSEACAFEWRRAKKVAAVRDGHLRVTTLTDDPPPPPDDLAGLRFVPLLP